jgi:hypothetical protein
MICLLFSVGKRRSEGGSGGATQDFGVREFVEGRPGLAGERIPDAGQIK